MPKPELLAPAGTREAFLSAVHAGCDAVYLAGKQFGARASASNFTKDEMIDLLRHAHLRGVKVFVTVNTLVFDDEVEELLAWTDWLVEQGVDALIVQDFGMIDLLTKRYPDTPIHASTQTNTYSVPQAQALKQLGVKRIVLARETDIATAVAIKRATGLEIEVFVHGALCVSYSGNCLHSSMIGGRSGNRGECAQPCRLPYRLQKDGVDQNEPTHILSTKDLMTIDHLGELIDAGIDSFKIEGRMRKPEYVAQAVLSYREAIEAHLSKRSFDAESSIDKLKRVYNRDYTSGYLLQIEPHTINQSKRPNHIGVDAGTVTNFRQGKASVELTDDLMIGDGVRFLSKEDYGMVVSRILFRGESVKTAKKGDLVVLDLAASVAVGTTMVKTLDIRLEESLRMYQDEAFKCIPIQGVFEAKEGEPLALTIKGRGIDVKTTHAFLAVAAQKQATTTDQALDQLSKLGGTPYYWVDLKAVADDRLFLPVKVLNELRRDALAAWEQAVLKQDSARIVIAPAKPTPFAVAKPGLIVHVETQAQYEAAVRHGVREIYRDESLDIDKPSGSVSIVTHGKRIRGETNNGLPAVAEELGILAMTHPDGWIAGAYLNVTNIHSAALFARHGAAAVTLSPEMSKERVEQFAKNYERTYGVLPHLELVVYGRVDLMITKYCPIAKTMGANKTHCHLCEHAEYAIEDRVGAVFPLKNDGACNIRVLNARPTMLFDYLHDLNKAGVIRHRIDFTVESGEEADRILTLYQQAMARALPVIERKLYTTGRFLR
jgi:putative protease